jgi:hypothetical protein
VCVFTFPASIIKKNHTSVSSPCPFQIAP